MMRSGKQYLQVVLVLAAVWLGRDVSAATYYVNDGSTNGDVYATAVGNDANAGTNASAPKLTVTNLLASYSLVQGDTVLIDTGIYSNYTVNISASGVSTNYVVFRGSTNTLGTIFDRRTNNADVISIDGSYVRVMNLTVRGGQRGVSLFVNSDCEFVNVYSVSNASGFYGSSASSHRFLRCVAARNTTGFEAFNSGIVWDYGVSWSNGTAFAPTTPSTVSISNSIIVGGTAHSVLPSAADYNMYWQTTLGGGVSSISELQATKANSFRSTWADPGFVNPQALDFHPTSPSGRYEPASQSFVTTDNVFGLSIDFGDPAKAYTNEPSPSGPRINGGNFGNTIEASKSQTSAWLFASVYNDGGQLTASGNLCWVYGGSVAATSAATLQYSSDGGTLWSNIVTGVRVTNSYYGWAATSATASLKARWRIVSDEDTNLFDACDANFVVRPATSTVFALYVNDASTNGDVYCSAVGSATNSGLSSNVPMTTIQGVIDTYDVGPGDTIYVDTGTYTNSVILQRVDQGSASASVTIRGSTNGAAGGTLFDIRNASLDVITLSDASHIRILNLSLRTGRYALNLSSASDCRFEKLICASNFGGVVSAAAFNHNFQHCVIARCGTGLQAGNTGWVWDHGVSWSNTIAFQVSATAISISNSVVVGGTAFGSGISPNNSDYNVYWQTLFGGSFNTLNDLQESTGHDLRSTVAHPQFADGGGLDFHPRSAAGRFDPSTNAFVADTNTSILVDLGSPSHSFSNEPAPNGGRLNIGNYGDTPEASKSPTNAWLVVLNYNDGGTITVPGDVLYWTGGNLSNQTVRVEFSSDSGDSWQVVQTNLAATNGSYVWANTNFGSSIFARWRIVLESNTNVFDSTDVDATLKSGPFFYYLNDASLNGDIYSTAIGSDTNLGTSAGRPKRTLQSLLDSHDVEPSDVIFVDTGTYLQDASPLMTALDTGNATNSVILRGSTNYAAGGSVFDRQTTASGTYALYLFGAGYLDIRDITFRNASTGLRIENGQGISLLRVTAEDCSQYGVHVVNSSGISLNRSVAASNGIAGVYVQGTEGASFNNGVVWKNPASGIRVDSGTLTVSNSVVVATGPAAFGYYAASITNLFGDYNDVYPQNQAVAGFIASLGRNADDLSAWVGLTTQELNSISADPLFADAEERDFHPKTAAPAGRYVLGLGYVATDPVTSPLIDSGNPRWAFTNEPSANGGRVNIGLYGNTEEASKGPTNAWLFASSHRYGGWARGTSTLHWVAGNFSPTGTVRVELSTDGGESWVVLTNSVRATNEVLLWNTRFTNDSPACLWSVTDVANTNIGDRTTVFFATRNTNLLIYVNNSTTSDDAFCSAPGVTNNWRAMSNAPIDSLATVFQLFDVEPGDQVLVDSGPYTNLANILVDRLDSGASNGMVRIMGSTTGTAASVAMYRSSPAAGNHGLVLQNAQWVSVSNLSFRAGHMGVVITNSQDLKLSVRSQNNSSNGVLIQGAARIDLSRQVIANNAGPGLALRSSSGVRMNQSILWSNAGSAFVMNGGDAVVSNSVLAVGAGQAYAYELSSTGDVLRSDYNDLFLSSTVLVARVGSGIYKTLSRWQQTLSNDVHSLTHDPAFADPASGDFHLKSAEGRYAPTGIIVTDTVSSLLIDAADPQAVFSSEPVPNGARLNMGIFGNTAQESRSPTNGWLVALTLSDGGSTRGTNTLYWVAGGSATDDLVRIEYSSDEGATWTNIATNISASAGQVTWTSTLFTSSSRGIWRITSLSVTSITDQTDNLFALNNGSLAYYVNDDSVAGDVYTEAAGSAANDGLQPVTPKRTIEQVLAAYDVGPGDQIFVDTGTYAGNSAVVIGEGVAGSPTNRLVIQGSTNVAAGGTVLNRGGAESGVEIRGTEGIALRHLVITNALRGVLLNQSTNCLLEFVRSEGARTAFEIRESFSNEIRNSIGYAFVGTGVWSVANSSVKVADSFFYTVGSSGVCVRADAGTIFVSNCVLWADGSPSVAYSIGLLATLVSDYNDILLTNGAYAARQERLETIRHIVQVSRLARDLGIERHSLTHDPDFFDLAGRDVHPASMGGRYDPSTYSFVTDFVSSVLIDAGDPSAPVGEETSPHGGRRNIGVFGGTAESSRTATNAFFTCVSLNDGGRAEGTNVVLYWVSRGDATGLPVRLEYSPRDGTNWVAIATSVPPGTYTYTWNASSFTSSPFARWRIVNPTNFFEYDRTDLPFALRNQPLVLYVNDASTNGDVYTSAAGSSTNLGISAADPKSSLREVLDTYDLEGGDTVYIDTGTYTNNGAYVLTEVDGGDSSNRVSFVGSTNAAAGGTIFDRVGLEIYENIGIELRHLTIALVTNAGSSTGINLERSTNIVIEHVHIRNGGDAFRMLDSQNIVMDHCSAAGMRTNGLISLQCQYVRWQNGVLWSNGFGAVILGGSASISNSILAAFGSGRSCLFISSANYGADYNSLYAANGATIASLDALPEVLVFDSLSRWARDTGWDTHSLSQWPGVTDPGGGDFHLVSTTGRYVSAGGYFTNDTATSPLVDAGNPSIAFGNEPSPNGNRINIGLHGNTGEASKTPTNPAITLVSYNDGGRVEGTNVVLYWVARGAATADLVRIEASPDAGLTWQVVASNIPAGPGAYTWNSTTFTTTVLALWRITSQTSTGVTDQSDSVFAVRNAPVSFYVNDASTNGDVYCTVPGALTNLGLTASAPLASLSLVLNTYDLEPGDTVFIDTGAYSSQVATTIGQLDSAGSVTAALVSVRGSTNAAAGGTILNGGGGAYAIQLDTAIGISLQNLTITNAATGVRVFKSHGSRLEWIQTRTSSRGIEIVSSPNVIMKHCIVRESQNDGVTVISSSGLQWSHGVLWSNAPYGLSILSSSISVSNSVIAVFGTNTYAYNLNGGSVAADYNAIYLRNGARAAFKAENPDSLIYESVSRWSRDETQDVHSLTHDPGFHDPSTGDFHLRSPAGRFVVTSGTFVVTDTNASLLIDAGAPTAAFSNESSPNGMRANVGAFGNTAEASLSPTSSALTAVSLNDGGRAEGPQVLLYWLAAGAATGHSLRLEFSADAGLNWQLIATNLPATNRSYSWNSLFYTSTVVGLWRVTSETDSNLTDRCDQMFALRNSPLNFYVNDGSTTGDVYAAAVGVATNWGLRATQPALSLQSVLDLWDIEAGDTIYVDTGLYPLGNPMTVSVFDAGRRTNSASGRVTIQGSTNQAFGGSVFDVTATKSKDGIVLADAVGMALRNLTIRDARVGVLLDGSDYAQLQYVNAITCIDGFKVMDASLVDCRNCSSIGCDDRGLISMGSVADTVWQNGLLWSNRQGAAIDSGRLLVNNSIIGSFGDGSFAYVFKITGTASSDYNNVVLKNGAFAGAVVTPGGFLGGTSRHESVATWVEATGFDHNTLTFDPDFVDPDNGDYHLKSKGGRYDPFLNSVVTDAVSSLIIDSGDPLVDVSDEPPLNGGRINIDLYGGTWQASRTPTNGWLSIISLNDGGDVSGTNVELRFFAGWVATGHLVYADYSQDNGATWTNIFTNHPASSNVYVWNSTNYSRSATARWRIFDQDDAGAYDESDATFILRTGGTIPYYVNDDSLVGDVYCQAVGSDLNTGLYPTSPVRNIQQILGTNRLQPRDFVYVDTGIYPLTNSIVIGEQDSGKGTNELIEIDGIQYPARVILVGSTNQVAGGSIIDGQGLLLPAFSLQGARSVEIRNFSVINAGVGVAVDGSVECVIDAVRAENNRTGFRISQSSSNVLFSHCLSRNNTTNGFLNDGAISRWESGVIWDNPSAVILEGGMSTFRHSVFNADGPENRVFRLSESAVVTNNDYNNLVRRSGALAAERQKGQGGNEVYPALSDWQFLEGQDSNSLSHDPLFADQQNGDFHLKSATGRFVPGVGHVADTVYSPMIDLGDPVVAPTNEPDPNGGLINIGLYGNTEEASLSSTNPWVLAVSLNDGGVVSDTGVLKWAYGNLPSTSLVTLAVSVDGGIEYVPLASNVPVGAKSISWQPCAFPLTSLAKWKLTSEMDTNVSDAVDGVFVIKCDVLEIYVNDLSTTGDIFCTAIGSPGNDGLSPGEPLLDPSDAFTRYYLSAGDTIYIDTGEFLVEQVGTGMVLGVENRGTPTAPIRILGSTNKLFGGTVIDRGNTANGVGLQLNQTRYIEVEHISVKGANVGVAISDSRNCRLEWVQCYSNSGAGFSISAIPSVTARYCAAWNNGGYGLSVGGNSSLTFENGVLWSNTLGAVQVVGSQLLMSNSLLHSVSPSSYLYDVLSADLHCDFNFLYKPSSNGLARNLFNNFKFTNLKRWQDTFFVDVHSVLMDPLLADPAGGDFHLMSAAGRPQGTNLVFDTNTSWAIDAGGFSSPFALEPAPNGSRHNAGLYGNTVRASRSLATTGSPELVAVRLNDGGTVAEDVELYWLYRGMSPTNRIRIEVSLDDGSSWRVLATNVSVSDQGYVWANTNPASPTVRWRVVSESNTNVVDASDTNFVLRVGPINYYVNDTGTVDDVYSSAPGSPFNSGLSNGVPLDSIQAVLDLYEVAKGDVIYVDTGIYTGRVLIGAGDIGETTQRVTIIGNTNANFAGTVIRLAADPTNAPPGIPAIRAEFTRGFQFQNIAIENAEVGIDLERCDFSKFINLLVRSTRSDGIRVATSSGNHFERVVVTRAGGVGYSAGQGGNAIVSSILWSNASHAVSLTASSLQISNSILSAHGEGNACLLIQTNSAASGDYNCYTLSDGALYAVVSGVPIEGLPQLTAEGGTTQDIHSLALDPLFANPANDDFHLQSQAGRYDPGSQTYVTSDVATSFLIDTGDPDAAFTNEPSPNGSRRNIGLYGNTDQASKSRTNAWLLAITASAGGNVEGDVYLAWGWGGSISPTNNIVLDYSYNDGITWTNIATVVVSTNSYLWTSALKEAVTNEKWPSSPLARWRLSLEGNTNVADTTDSTFALHNRPFFFYCNDTSTVNDVYTTAVGSDTNLGLFPYEPLLTMGRLLDLHDVQGTDTILLDTGAYVIETNSMFVIGPGDQGLTNKYVVIQGSTNFAAGGSRLIKGSTIAGSNIVTVAGSYVELRHLRLTGAGVSLFGQQTVCTNLVLTNGGVSVVGPGSSIRNTRIVGGGLGLSGTNIAARQVQVLGGATVGGVEALVENCVIVSTNGTGVSLIGNGNTLRNNTIVSLGTAFELVDSDTFVTLENNILVADGSGQEAYCILRREGLLLSDYNNLVSRNGAWIGSANGKWEKLTYWQRESLLDAHSMAAEPLFADEAAFDFHLKSKAGRYSNGVFVIDAVHSPAIDGGRPSASVGLEPAPNGSRINLGAYGGTLQASKSLTNGWFTLLTANDGGVLKGANVPLQWNASSFPSSSTVTIQYSPDAGTTWTTIVTGLSATNRSYTWVSTLYTSSLTGLIRIYQDGNTNVVDTTDTPFALRNTPMKFYVNDGITSGDVFTTTNGAPGNTGTTPQDPLSSVQAVLNAYDLESLDTIYVDTGSYILTSDVSVIWSDGGDSAGAMMIRGSTNVALGGSVVNRDSQAENSDGFDVKASYVTLRDLTVHSANRGVLFDSNRFSTVERMLLYSNVVGVANVQAAAITNKNLRLWRNINGIDISNSRTTVVENCTFVANSSNGVAIFQSFSNIVQNNIFYLNETNSAAFLASSNVQVAAAIDYNVYYFATNNTTIDRFYVNLLDRQRQLGKDYRSNITNPLMQDANSGDFHLKSTAGRFLDSANGFVLDAVNSWGIDHGNPASTFTNEPLVNGARANIGAYGNTEYASKGATSLVTDIRTGNTPTTLSTNDNPLPVIWSSLNAPSGATVRVEYSGDGGLSWAVLATNVPVTQEFITWNLTPQYNTYGKGLLRVVGEGGNPYGIGDTNNAPINLFFGEFEISSGTVNTNAGMIVWRGAWGETYQVQYADMIMLTNSAFAWSNAVNGVAANQKANFQSTVGGDFTYEDPQSTGAVRRLYRVILEQYEP